MKVFLVKVVTDYRYTREYFVSADTLAEASRKFNARDSCFEVKSKESGSLLRENVTVTEQEDDG